MDYISYNMIFSFFLAVRSSSIKIIELLLKSGAKTNLQTNGGKSTALHRACLKGRPEVVQILIGKLIFKNLILIFKIYVKSKLIKKISSFFQTLNVIPIL